MKIFLHKYLPKLINPKNNLSLGQQKTLCGYIEGSLSILINMTMFGLKMGFGWTIQSHALMADAFHSFADSLSSIAIMIGLKASNKPPDIEHPFGHGRLEFITTLVMSGLLLVAGYELLKSSLGDLSHPQILEPSLSIYIIMLITILANEFLARFAFILGDYCDSETLKVDGYHHRSDAISSLFVIVALLAKQFQWPIIDNVVGVILSLWIIGTAIIATKKAISPLIGEAPTPEELKAVQNIALAHVDIHHIHDIIFHKYGHNRLISVHIEISDTLSLLESHQIAEDVEEAIKKQLKATVVVHTDPINPHHARYPETSKAIEQAVTHVKEINNSYAIRIIDYKNKSCEATFSIALKQPNNLSHAQVRTRLLQELKHLVPDIDFTIHIAPEWAFTPR
jgi:cation diffusion facilitator family transporter